MQVLQGPAYMHEYSDNFVDHVRAMSGGRINIELFPADQLVPTEELMEMTGRGMIDGSTQAFGGYWSDEIDVGAIEGGMPGTWRNTWEVDYYFYELGFLELVRESYAEHNVFYLSHTCADPYELFTREPINSLDELRKIKIRATGATAEMFAELGVPTEYFTFSEQVIRS